MFQTSVFKPSDGKIFSPLKAYYSIGIRAYKYLRPFLKVTRSKNGINIYFTNGRLIISPWLSAEFYRGLDLKMIHRLDIFGADYITGVSRLDDGKTEGFQRVDIIKSSTITIDCLNETALDDYSRDINGVVIRESYKFL